MATRKEYEFELIGTTLDTYFYSDVINMIEKENGIYSENDLNKAYDKLIKYYDYAKTNRNQADIDEDETLDGYFSVVRKESFLGSVNKKVEKSKCGYDEAILKLISQLNKIHRDEDTKMYVVDSYRMLLRCLRAPGFNFEQDIDEDYVVFTNLITSLDEQVFLFICANAIVLDKTEADPNSQELAEMCNDICCVLNDKFDLDVETKKVILDYIDEICIVNPTKQDLEDYGEEDDLEDEESLEEAMELDNKPELPSFSDKIEDLTRSIPANPFEELPDNPFTSNNSIPVSGGLSSLFNGNPFKTLDTDLSLDVNPFVTTNNSVTNNDTDIDESFDLSDYI